MVSEFSNGSIKGQDHRSLVEAYAESFCAWEKRTRGWHIWPYPVPIEPLFVPLHAMLCPHGEDYAQPAPKDDGARNTVLSGIAGALSALVKTQHPKKKEVKEVSDKSTQNEPMVYTPLGKIVELQILLPKDTHTNPRSAKQLLLSLSYTHYPVSFEIIGTHKAIVVQLACFEDDAEHVWAQIEAHVPESVIVQQERYLKDLWRSEDGQRMVVDFGLAHEGMMPLVTPPSFENDPLVSVIGALSYLEENSVGIVQILFRSADQQWGSEMLHALTDDEGKAIFSDAPQWLPAAKQKVDAPLFGAVVRVATRAPTKDEALSVARRLGSGLCQFAHPIGNSLVPLENTIDDVVYIDTIHALDVLRRMTHRAGILLNITELSALVHLPSAAIKTVTFVRATRRTKAAPALIKNHPLYLGKNMHRGKSTAVTLSQQQRSRHMYVIGASGTGKTTMLQNMIIQDMQQGKGLAILDPHGDLIDKVLGYIPKKRRKDVIVFDPSDEQYPIGFNILEAHSEQEKILLASDLTSVFRRLSTSWGDQMNSVLANSIIAMLESSEGGTLLTMRRFLVDKKFRAEFLSTIGDPENVFYWSKEFPLLSGRAHAPVLTRLDMFLRPKPIRYMVAQKTNKINFRHVMDQGKILLAKLPQGAIGEENSYLLGTFLVAKLNQAAFSRQALREKDRRPFYLYIDEFHNFVTPSMATILSGARKFGLALVLTHQDRQQLEARDQEVAASTLSNPYTRVCFRLGDDDAKKLQKGMAFYEAQDLQSLGIGEAIARVERAEYDFNLKTPPLPDVSETKARKRTRAIIHRSRATYGVPRAEVEAELHVHTQIHEDPPEKPAAQKPPPPAKENPPPKTQKPPKKKVVAQKPQKSQGRGGAQHQYLQGLLQKLAEEHGYKATIEHAVLGGKGYVDVLLTRGGHTIGCEVVVHSNIEHELENIQKCITAGCEEVVMISHEAPMLRKLKKRATKALPSSFDSRVHFLSPEQFMDFLDTNAPVKNEKRVRGYKVKVNYAPGNETEQRRKQQAIARIIVQSMKTIR